MSARPRFLLKRSSDFNAEEEADKADKAKKEEEEEAEKKRAAPRRSAAGSALQEGEGGVGDSIELSDVKAKVVNSGGRRVTGGSPKPNTNQIKPNTNQIQPCMNHMTA